MEEEINNQEITSEEQDLTQILANEVGFSAGEDIDLEVIQSVPIEVSVVLGETKTTVEQLLKMGKGAVIELERKVGDPVDLYVNERLVAKGEVVVVEDKIGITMTEIIKNDKNE